MPPSASAASISRSARRTASTSSVNVSFTPTKQRSAPTAYPAIARPSSTWYGLIPSRCRSLNVAGSPSAPLHTANLVPVPVLRIDRHFSPVGNPAPPRPRSPLFVTSSMTASGAARRATSRPRPPPAASYSPNVRGAMSSRAMPTP